MRYLHLLVFLIGISFVACATTKSQDDVTENPAGTNQDFGDTSEKDLTKEFGAQSNDQPADAESPPPAAGDNPDQNPPPAVDNKKAQAQGGPEDLQPLPPPDEQQSTPPAENVGATDAAAPTGKPARVTGLDFNANLNGGTIILKTNKPVTYTTRKNQSTNQYVIELQNTLVPKRFRRPYNTKEFSSTIGSINAYQAKGMGKIARIVVQLKDAGEPGIEQTGRVIKIAGGGGATSAPSDQVAQNTQAEPTGSDEEAEANGSDVSADTTASSSTGNDAQDTSQMPSGQKAMSDFLLGTSKYYGRPISLEVKDADIRDVFRLISEESGINLLVQEDVTGKVSLKLRRIPWDQALAVILQSKQLGYVKQGNILRIAPLHTIEAESDSARKIIDAQRNLLPLRVKLFPVNYALASDIETQVKDLLSPRGKARADKRTNMLVVTDVDEVVSKVKALVDRLDAQTPQVLIEAKVVEARENYQRLIGVNWNFSGAPVNVGTNSLGQTTTMTPRLVVQPVGSDSGGIFDLGAAFGNLDVFGSLDASLKLLESEGIAKVLSAPRIVTLDRETAKIEQTTSFPNFTSIPSPTGVAVPVITFQDVHLTLSVKPQISADGGIIMDVDILREFADPPVTGPGGGTSRPINRRHATTKVLVENGDTVVIGGIYQSDVAESETGVPWLRKIPILGALFRSRAVTRDKNELVIFLTPRILNREKAFAKAGGAG